MSRKKISEYRAKKLIYETLGRHYEGRSVNLRSYDADNLRSLLGNEEKYVVKVDQAVKKRNQLNLVRLDLTPEMVNVELARFATEGYQWALIEPYYPHSQTSERFLALQRVGDGIDVSYCIKGGVDVEKYSDQVQKSLIATDAEYKIEFDLEENVKQAFISIMSLFEDTHMTYLEINPLLVENASVIEVLDAAVEVDAAAEFFVNDAWSTEDFRDSKKELHETEKAVDELAATSPSSLSLKVLNENGSLFLLLSGGGASVVVADEISNLGHHNDMANYGEYSGNPTEEETYLYTKQVLKLLLKSSSEKKILIIAGGVANFTDVSKTFKGIIRAITDHDDELLAQQVEVFVRRGGPNQKNGLLQMKNFLETTGIKNSVNGPEISLANIVQRAIERIEK